MNVHSFWSARWVNVAVLFPLLLGAACSDGGSSPTDTVSAGGEPPGIVPGMAGGSSSAGGSAGAPPTAPAMGGTGGNSPKVGDGGATLMTGGVGNNPVGDGGQPPVIDAGPVDGAPPPAGDGGSAPDSTPGVIPDPVSSPYVWGFGIGVSDIEGAMEFFTDVMQMNVEKDGIKREDRTETILYGSQANRGARLVLMHYDDGRATRKITAKLVWQASNPSAVNTAASTYPDYTSRLNFGIVQFDGPDTYIQEVGSIFDTGGAGITVPYLVALGFSVSNQTASRGFYTGLGMDETPTGTFSVTDATGRGTITEYTLRFSTGSGLVLQNWSPERNSKDNPVKVVLFVPDAEAAANEVVAGGGSVLHPAERSAVYDNRLLVVTKDPDGYLLELVQ